MWGGSYTDVSQDKTFGWHITCKWKAKKKNLSITNSKGKMPNKHVTSHLFKKEGKCLEKMR